VEIERETKKKGQLKGARREGLGRKRQSGLLSSGADVDSQSKEDVRKGPSHKNRRAWGPMII